MKKGPDLPSRVARAVGSAAQALFSKARAQGARGRGWGPAIRAALPRAARPLLDASLRVRAYRLLAVLSVYVLVATTLTYFFDLAGFAASLIALTVAVAREAEAVKVAR